MGVTIWEGSKAQALIDAINNKNSDSGIPDSVKRALLACFQNTAWINKQGQALYDSLYTALYSSEGAGSVWHWHYKNDGSGNAVLANYGAGCRNIYGDFVYRGYLAVIEGEELTNRRAIYATSGVYPILNADTLSPTNLYPIPIPSTATKFILDSNMELLCRCIICRYANDDETYKYIQVEQTSASIDQTLPLVHNFDSGENLYMTMFLKKPDDSVFDGETEPEISIMFE